MQSTSHDEISSEPSGMNDSDDSHHSDRLHFETTHWSIVLGANEAISRRQALRDLCERYWSPLYAFLRRSGQDAHDAQDLTQAFLRRCSKTKV